MTDDYNHKKFADRVALNKEIRDRMKSVNPYALHNILNKLLEAAARGVWNADDHTVKEFREAFLDIEGDIGEVTE